MVLLYNLARGNLEPGTYHLFGQGATGKTTVAMCCAASVAARGRPVAWIDAGGGFSAPRFAQISTATTGRDHSNRVLLNKAANPLALDNALKLLQQYVATWRPGLAVLDTAFGTFDQATEDPALRRVLWIQAKEQLSRLVLLCNSNKIPLLLVNGVGYKPGADQERPTGEAIVACFRPESAVTRHVIGPGGKTGRISYLSCDDETTFAITGGGIEQKDAAIAAHHPAADEEDEDEEVAES
jgi:RecA/RadA recombinase